MVTTIWVLSPTVKWQESQPKPVHPPAGFGTPCAFSSAVLTVRQSLVLACGFIPLLCCWAVSPDGAGDTPVGRGSVLSRGQHSSSDMALVTLKGGSALPVAGIAVSQQSCGSQQWPIGNSSHF